MAFITPNYEECDEVSFHTREDFADRSSTVIHFIKRGDERALQYYIRKYMDTHIKQKRPDTPAKLIIPFISKTYTPPF